jgi:enoyl-CoA hydratase/carnithine racemase
MTGAEISAEEALRLGVVAEVVAHGQVMDRARAIARQLVGHNPQMLRFSRVALTQHIKRRMLDDLGYGLMLEGMGLLGLVGK